MASLTCIIEADELPGLCAHRRTGQSSQWRQSGRRRRRGEQRRGVDADGTAGQTAAIRPAMRAVRGSSQQVRRRGCGAV